jgi:hypothetical protein
MHLKQMKLSYMSFDFWLSLDVFKHNLTNVEEFSTFLPFLRISPILYIYIPNLKKLARVSSFWFFLNKPIFKVLVL